MGGGRGVECWASGYVGEDGLIDRRMGTETDMDASMEIWKALWLNGWIVRRIDVSGIELGIELLDD